ncbi:MAG TPA: mevalonate kinase [Chloroflexi bacterium]|nr:mevalonate kinase [Chloroflexota bacterium]
MTEAQAYAKLILFGEHAVVYGRPAIAAPLQGLSATARLADAPHVGRQGILIRAVDLGNEYRLEEAPAEDPLAKAIQLAMDTIGAPEHQGLEITIESSIPVAAGLGSSAAITVALLRGLSLHFDKALTIEQISNLAYEVERLHHGTPSGIDNTVIAWENPIYFVRGQIPRRFRPGRSLHLVLGHSGITTPTSEAVLGLRQRWERDSDTYERLFDAIGEISRDALEALQAGELARIGSLMDANQSLLESLGVSLPELERLTDAARQAGALGAKLSGAGQGGIMVALTLPESASLVEAALLDHGAEWVRHATIAG